MHRFTLKSVAILVHAMFVGCTVSPSPESATLDHVLPNKGYNDNPIEVTIRGDGLAPRVYRNLSSCGLDNGIRVDDTFEATLEAALEATPGTFALTEVTWVDDSTLKGTIPAEMIPGLYDLTVVLPSGKTVDLPGAYEVLKDAIADTDSDTEIDTNSDGDTDSETDTGSETDTDSDTDDDSFCYQRSIVINHAQVGTDNSGTLPATGFPVLVSLAGDWLKTTTVDPDNGHIESSTGDDIIFTKSDGITDLDHEIEHYDGTNGILVAWVRIDSLSKSEDTKVYIFYGNKCTTPATASPGEVWDENFMGVWHFDDPTDSPVMDSTGNGNDGTPSGNPAATNPGKIAGALDFDGIDDHVSLEVPKIVSHEYDAFTVAAWYKSADFEVGPPSGEVDDEYIFFLGDPVTRDPVIVMCVTDDSNETGHLRLTVSFNKRKIPVYSTTSVVNSQWHHLAVVRTGDVANPMLFVYVDGELEQDKQDNTGGGVISMDPSTYIPHIGGVPNSGDNKLHGSLDELRFSTAVRSADWIKTEYNNQSDTAIGAGKFISSLGPEQ